MKNVEESDLQYYSYAAKVIHFFKISRYISISLLVSNANLLQL